MPKENCEIWEESGGNLIPNYSLYSDIAGYTAPHGGTIPPNILVTSLKPDLFIVNEREAKAILFELTVPWDANIQRSHVYKEGKYAALIADLSQRLTVYHFSIEISVRGLVTKDNRCRLKAFIYRSCSNPGKLTKKVAQNASKAALLASFSIFSARKEPSWINPTAITIYWIHATYKYML